MDDEEANAKETKKQAGQRTSSKEEEEGEEGGWSLCRACVGTYCVVTAVAVRALLLLHALLCVWLVVSLTHEPALWGLAVLGLLLVVDAVYIVVRRGGRESKWFCPCILAYLVAALPPVWLIELNRFGRFQEALQNSGNLTSLTSVTGLTVPIKLEPEVWVSVMEQTLLFVIIVARWLLPRGDISRHELSQLLFVFVGIASDNVSLFELFDENEVRTDPVLTYVIMGVWTFSFVQFLFVLTATKSPQQVAVIHDNGGERRPKVKVGLIEVLFTTESWSLLFSVMTQDGPYGAVRIYTVVKHNLITYSIIFFICKNLFVICLILYRLFVVCMQMSEKEGQDNASAAASSPSSARQSPKTSKSQ
ncbi:transmembrane protein 26-like [Babylonia areolata]|uniref:transmembrane protein 26-like n=1 Tax=Babylonia areolata TaxID=304850 RepID=UPI003FD5EEDE